MTHKQIGAAMRKARGQRSIREVAGAINKQQHAMTAAEVLSNAKAYATLKSLQGLDKLAAFALNEAMGERYTCHDGSAHCNENKEAQFEYRQSEVNKAIDAQARYWGMDREELVALVLGDHKLQTK